MKKLSIIVAVVMGLSMFGCNQVNQPGDLLADIEENPLGKADGTDNIQIIIAEEELYSNPLKEKLCEAVREYEYADDIYAENCAQNFIFTVTEIGKSVLYAYQADFRPITMRLKVKIEDLDNEMQWDGVLTRDLSAYYDLTWHAVVDGGPGFNVNDYILEIAYDAGEYACEWDDWDHKATPVSYEDVSQLIKDKVDQYVTEGNAEDPFDSGSPVEIEISDDCHAEIIKDGEVVGYVISINYYVNHPYFDGGGVNLYYNANGNLVTEVEWWA
jgi:hypothetical protein